MTSEQSHLLSTAAAMEIAAHELALVSRSIDSPSESYRLLGELEATQRHLAQVYEQLAAWHGRVVDGVEFDGEDSVTAAGMPGALRAELALRDAAAAAETASAAVDVAHAANGVIRWFDRPRV